MTDEHTESLTREDRVDEAIASFLAAIDAGQAPDPREWLGRHADLAPELEQFLADQELLAPLVAPIGPRAGDERTTLNAVPDPGEHPAGATPGAAPDGSSNPSTSGP